MSIMRLIIGSAVVYVVVMVAAAIKSHFDLKKYETSRGWRDR